MIWWVVIAAYVASVALSIVASRVESKVRHNYDIGWLDVIGTPIPVINVIFSIVIFQLAASEYGPPHWLIRLYGGKVR